MTTTTRTRFRSWQFEKAEDEYDDEDDFILSMFDHEKLDVYQLSLHFLTWVTPLL